MPWAVLVRMIARLAAGLLIWRTASARRNPVPGSPTAPLRSPRAAAAARLGSDDVLRQLRESASLGWRALSAVAFLLAATVLTTGGVTLTVLSPRWLGIALLTLAAAALVLAAVEGLAARRLLSARLRRRRDAALRRQVS